MNIQTLQPSRIHSSYIDPIDTPSDYESYTSESNYLSWRGKNESNECSNQNNWRSKEINEPKQITPSLSYFGRGNNFNKYNNRDNQLNINKNSLKYCPGNSCMMWLPVHQFSSNCNMKDGMDMYCIECNIKKRKERDVRRNRNKGSKFVIDNFEKFCFDEQSNIINNSNEKNKILDIIKQNILNSRLQYDMTIPVNEDKIYDKIFNGRRLVCEITGNNMTTQCFLAHHEIQFKQKGTMLDIKCTNCKIPT